MRVEGYGNKGLKNLPWRKTFKNADAMCDWAEKHDATIIGSREVSEEEWQANGRR